MHQVQMEEYGAPAVLHVREVPDAEPGAGQVAVRTAAAGVTFVETQLRTGRPPWPGPGPALPAVLGNGVEGTIVSAGAGVDPGLVGMQVVTATGGLGGYADRVVVGAADPVPVPAGLARGAAVAILADGRTALGLIRAAAISTGDRVLVTAAAGGVGSLLVQLARAAGATCVAAAASSARKLEVARSLGADVVADYSSPGWAKRVRAETGTLDVIFDGVGGEIGNVALDLLGRGGRFLAYGAASGTFTGASGIERRDIESRGIEFIPGNTVVRTAADNRALVEQGLALATAGRLQPVIGQVFPLSRAADAHAAIEARTTIGKTILVPG
jgi:NADPH2:quinone reductase